MSTALCPRSLSLLLPCLAAMLVPSPLPACGPSFYAAAPALIAGELPLSIKTLAELYDLTVTPPPSQEQAASTRAARVGAAAEAMKLPAAEARARLDVLLAENRKTGWQPAVANLLWDLRDTCGSAPETSAERERWIAWRLSSVRDNSVTTIQRPVALNASRFWTEAAENIAKARTARAAASEQELAAMRAAGMDSAPPALQPHWRVQAGAVWFRHWDFNKALVEFESAARDFPQSPRAETAAFMALRCRIELARDAIGEWHQRQQVEAANQCRELQTAWESYHRFAEKHSQGRFAADLPGWRGALHLIAGDWTMAFCAYIEQADFPDPPALSAGALREAERSLRLAAEHEGADPDLYNREPVEILTAHPRAAARFVYHLLEPAAAVDFDQWPWTSEFRTAGEIVKFRRATRWQIREAFLPLLPALARELERSAVSKANAGAGQESWDPFALAVIAWAACEEEQYERVLTLCRNHPAAFAAGDDLQMVRAIALQRMGRPAEAVRAWNALSTAFPKSPLRAQAEQRSARCLMEAGDPASALALLVPPPDPRALHAASAAAAAAPTASTGPAAALPPAGKSPEEIWQENWQENERREEISGSLTGQWRDVLALAAPLESLQKMFLSRKSAGSAPWFGPIIASRLAGRGEFVLAREFLTGPGLPVPEERQSWLYDTEGQPGPSRPEAPDWESIFAASAQALQYAANASRDNAGAQAWLDAGEKIAELREKWAFEGLTGGYMNSEGRQWELRLRRNARSLGYSAEAVTEEILRQDPLTLASECWAKAVAAAPESHAAARALFLQNEALRLRAEYSPLAAAVADERDWTAESARLTAALRTLRNLSPEAAELADAAVPWEFQDMPWLPSNIPQAYADDALLQALAPITGPEAAAAATLPDIAALTKATWQSGGAEAALRKLEELRALSCSAVVSDDDTERFSALRLIGDLRAAMSIPNLTPEQRGDCLDWIAGTPLDVLKHTAGWEDLVSYATLRAFDFPRYSPEQPAAWQLWISENPGSVRKEDAEFQFLRAECRRHRGWTRFTNTAWPEGPLTNSWYLMINVDRTAPAAPEAVKSLLDSFDRRWPDSRFAADLALLRCGAAIDRRDWPCALDQVIPLLETNAHREVHMDAAHLAADLFLQLLEPENRAPLAEAIRTRPAALQVLSRFMTSNTPGGRLLPLRDWLGLPRLQVPPPAEDWVR